MIILKYYHTVFLILLVLIFSGCTSKKNVHITSDPSGASIYLNGGKGETTPLTKDLSFDEVEYYEAIAKLDGYDDKTKKIYYEPRSEINYHFNLEPNMKQVRIISLPDGATIYINGEERGITPLTKDLPFNEVEYYEVIAKLDGYSDKTEKIYYEPRSKINYRFNLEPNMKQVRITSLPDGATIYINGEEAGIAPLTKKLSFKETNFFEILARKDGFKDSKTSIYLKPTARTDYNLLLEKIETVSVELVSFEPKRTDQGVKLAIIRKPTLAYLEIIERSPNVKSVTKLTNNEDRGYQIGGPILSPVEDVLVYRVFVEEENGTSYSNIWKTIVGSFGKTRVTYGKWRDLFPSFQSAGKYLIFSSNRTSPHPTLWRIRIDGGGGITNITNTLSEDYSPSVSPQDDFISYTSNPPSAEEPQIWTIGINGQLPTQLREGESPQISPDGNKILFVREDKISKRKQIWVMNVDGGQETQLTQNSDYDTIQPKWSPDGKWIVFISDEGLDSYKRQNYDIWMMTAEGSQKTQLTTNGSRDDNPCWDRTGKYINFRSNRGGAWNIWRFEPTVLP